MSDEHKHKNPDTGSLSSNQMKLIAICIRFLICLFILFIGFKITKHFWDLKRKPKKKAQEELVKRLVATPVKAQDIKLKISGYADAEPDADILISSEVEGKITFLHDRVSTGELVKKGEVLCRIEKTDYETALNLNLADIKKLKAHATVKKRLIDDTKKELDAIIEIFNLEINRYQRTKQLFEKKVVSKDAYESALQEKVNKQKQRIIAEGLLAKNELELETVQADIVKAEANAKQARKNIERCKIKAPFTGRVNKVFVDPDEYIKKGDPILELSDETCLSLSVALDALDAAKVLGLLDQDHAKDDYAHWLITPGNVPVYIEWTQYPEKCCFEGRLVRIRKFDKDTRTINFVVEPTKYICRSIPLVSGMFCKVTLVGKTVKNAFKIPKVAVQFDNDVYIVNKEGRLESRKVNIIGTQDDKLIVDSGLKNGDLVVVQRIPRGMPDGTKVTPIAPIPEKKATEKKVKTVIHKKENEPSKQPH